MKDKKWISIILIFSLIKGILWMFLFPPWQTPDESSHFSYVQYVGETGKVPVIGEKADGFSAELLHFMSRLSPPTPMAFHPEVKAIKDPAVFKELLHQKSTKEERLSSGSTPAAGYPPGYYGLAAIIYKLLSFAPFIVRFYAVRFFSVCLGLIAVYFAYLIGKKLFPLCKQFSLTLAIMTSFHPMFSMTAISVNNDILMVTASIVIVYWLMLAIDSFNKRIYVLGGLLLGFGLLVKAHMLFVVAVTLFILTIYLWKKSKSIKRTVMQLCYVLSPAVLLYHGWAFFSWQVYGSLLGAMGFQPKPQVSPTASWYLNYNFFSSDGWYRFYDLWVKMYWAKFGWLDTVFASVWLYKLILVLMILSFIGVTIGLIKRKHNKIWMFVVFYLGNILFLYATEMQYFMKFNALMLQGRYVFTSLVPLNIIIILGLTYLSTDRYKRYVHYFLRGGMLIFNIFSIILVYQRYYVLG